MSEDETKTLDARLLQQILTKLEMMDVRLQFVEGKIRERGFDTKPIWERALKEIMDVNQNVRVIDRKIDVLGKDILGLRADQLAIEDRLSKLESDDLSGVQSIN